MALKWGQITLTVPVTELGKGVKGGGVHTWSQPQGKWIQFCMKNCIGVRSSIWLDTNKEYFSKAFSFKPGQMNTEILGVMYLTCLKGADEEERQFCKERPPSGSWEYRWPSNNAGLRGPTSCSVNPHVTTVALSAHSVPTAGLSLGQRGLNCMVSIKWTHAVQTHVQGPTVLVHRPSLFRGLPRISGINDEVNGLLGPSPLLSGLDYDWGWQCPGRTGNLWAPFQFRLNSTVDTRTWTLFLHDNHFLWIVGTSAHLRSFTAVVFYWPGLVQAQGGPKAAGLFLWGTAWNQQLWTRCAWWSQRSRKSIPSEGYADNLTQK